MEDNVSFLVVNQLIWHSIHFDTALLRKWLKEMLVIVRYGPMVEGQSSLLHSHVMYDLILKLRKWLEEVICEDWLFDWGFLSDYYIFPVLNSLSGRKNLHTGFWCCSKPLMKLVVLIILLRYLYLLLQMLIVWSTRRNIHHFRYFIFSEK